MCLAYKQGLGINEEVFFVFEWKFSSRWRKITSIPGNKFLWAYKDDR